MQPVLIDALSKPLVSHPYATKAYVKFRHKTNVLRFKNTLVMFGEG